MRNEGTFDLQAHPHRRYNPLTREWVLVSPHRTQRPWQGQLETAAAEQRPHYDDGCYLCPGNQRSGGARNTLYTTTFVFDNDFPALRQDFPSGDSRVAGLLNAEAEAGICRVICYSPRHDLTLAQMSVPEIRSVVILPRVRDTKRTAAAWRSQNEPCSVCSTTTRTAQSTNSMRAV